MPRPRPKYNLGALKKNLEKCDSNIALFQEAIQKEYENKARLNQLIHELEKEKIEESNS